MKLNKKLETQLNLYKEFNENQILLHELNKALKQRDQYKQENEELREQFDYRNQSYMKLYEENEKLKEELLQSDYVKASVLSDREEYKKQIVKLHEELKTMKLQNEELKRKR